MVVGLGMVVSSCVVVSCGVVVSPGVVICSCVVVGCGMAASVWINGLHGIKATLPTSLSSDTTKARSVVVFVP